MREGSSDPDQGRRSGQCSSQRSGAETLVRGKTLEAFADASVKTDRSFKAGALAMGAGYRIETMPGYLPSLWQSAPEEMADAVKALVGEKRYTRSDRRNTAEDPQMWEMYSICFL
ncbi:MAG: hypothetical protein ACLR6I_06605 [Waltera sp.]